MMKKKRVVAVLLVGTTVIASLSGCSSSVGTDVTKLPLVSQLTEKEVIDYYAEALKYDAVITKNNEVYETTYVERDVSDSKRAQLLELQGKAQEILGGMDYEYTRDNVSLVSEDTFHYIKSYLNGNKLDNAEVVSVTGALGYYFVDVKYDISASSIGEFTDQTSLMGINGAFVQNALGEDYIDTAFLTAAVDKINSYYADNKILKSVTYNEDGTITEQDEDYIIDNTSSAGSGSTYYNNSGNGTITGTEPYETLGDGTTSSSYDANGFYNGSVDGEGNPTDNNGNIIDIDIPQAGLDSLLSNITNTTESTASEESSSEEASQIDETYGGNASEGTGDGEFSVETTGEGETGSIEELGGEAGEEESTEYTTEVSTQEVDGMQYTSYTPANRQCAIDTETFNSIVGSSYKSVAYMPSMDLVFTKPEAEGTISGIGIYPSGGNGLSIFGFDRSSITGTCTLRYVFKDSSDGTGAIVGVNVYPKSESITNGFSTTDGKVVVPEFLTEEFEKLLERADRATIDTLIASMIGGSIYEDMGFAVLRGYEAQHVNLTKNMSTIRQVVARDLDNNAYLLEVETTRIEGPKDVDAYGTYRDKSYIVVQQKGSEFVITDQIRVSRTLSKEPAIDPDSSTTKRLVALNLAGAVGDTEKQEVQELLNDWYNAGTLRVINASEDNPKTFTYKGNEVTVTKGMDDCFNSDTTMLASSKREYMNSEVRALLIKKGTDVTSEYTGLVTEWMGGYENQVEFTTEELISYDGQNEGEYMEVYYLVSKMEDEWVIDERTVLSEKTVNDSELSTIQSRLSN